MEVTRATPRISLVIPAWNEAKYLPRLLDTIDAARARYVGGGDAIEVIVADNDSTDDTATIARGRGCRVAHVKKRRIAASRNGGAAIARGEIVCFVDADFRIHPESFNFIDQVMSDGRYIGGGTGLRMERHSPGIRLTLAAVMPLLWLVGVDGGIWFCRRADFHEAGGYDERQLISEDVRFLLELRKLGRSRTPRLKMATGSTLGRKRQARAICSTRKFDTHGEWHFLRDVGKLVMFGLFSRRRFEAHAKRYWYEDER